MCFALAPVAQPLLGYFENILRTSVHLNKLIKGNAQHQFKLSKKLNIATTFNVIVNFLLY